MTLNVNEHIIRRLNKKNEKLSVVLVGGSSKKSGNVFAKSPITGSFGPVCDDRWDINDVSLNINAHGGYAIRPPDPQNGVPR